MLVLTRKSQEQIRIGNDIVVTVLRVKGNSVRVGIEAPREVRVIRGELPPKENRCDPEVAEMILKAVEQCEAVEDQANGNADTAPAERMEQSFSPPRRTLKDYVAGNTSHAV